ncbi:MAG: fructosamine kinase family protein [Planctomycetota bacterium]
MNEELQVCLADKLGGRIRSVQSIGGGDLSEAFCVTLADGQVVFAKTMLGADPTLFSAEAAGLEWLRTSTSLTIPEVLAVSSPKDSEPPFLVLEWLEAGTKSKHYGERLGRGLAELHRASLPEFGLNRDNFLGPLRQENTALTTWAEFYSERRLQLLWKRAQKLGLTTSGFDRGMEALIANLAAAMGPPEPPSRLHGDLWSGNVMTTSTGRPALIDPAVYGGHREIDLAMLKLFGFAHPEAFSAYEESFPLAEGADQRIPLYQLYPLLAHLNLFGGGYLASCENALRQVRWK